MSASQSPLDEVPKHVAVIMDGNGRWAERRGLPRSRGHKAGVDALKSVVRAANEFDIQYLTLFSFSSENWNRPKSEINELFSLLKLFIRRDLAELHENNVCVKIIGRRNDLPNDIFDLLSEAENLTRSNDGQVLTIAFNYGSRDEIVRATQKLTQEIDEGKLSPSQIDSESISRHLDTYGTPDPDLIIRTSGEKRLSNFLMWQAAYSEFIFDDRLWPEFNREAFWECLQEYGRRTRKFGGLVQETG